MQINSINPYILSLSKPQKFQSGQNQNILNVVSNPEQISASDSFSPFYAKIQDSQVSREEIEQEIRSILDEGCKTYGIPDELKPKIVIIDSIQYAPEEEIDKKFQEALNSDVDLDIFSGSKKQPHEMSRNEFIGVISKQTGLSKKEVEKIIQTGNGKDKGFYSSANNTITYYTDGYRQGKETIEETILHELYHAKEAIVRSALPQEERDKIVKEELLSNLAQREIRNVFKQFPPDNNMADSMMTVPIFDEKTRAALNNFAQQNLFTENWSLHEKMQRYSELLEQKNPDEAELAKAKADLGGLAEQIEEIADNGKIYSDSLLKTLFGVSKKEKNKLIFDYMMSVEFRYQYFREKEIKNVPETQKAAEYRDIAKKSISEHIGSTQATFAMNIARQSRKKTGDELYWEYYTSREEVRARINSEKREVEKLKFKLTNSIGNSSRAEIKAIKKQLNEKKAKYREDLVYCNFFEAEDEFKSDPKNIRKGLKYFISNYKVQIMKTTHHSTTSQKIALGAYAAYWFYNGLRNVKRNIRI